MKIIHLSDLHLGKRISDFSMTEDQKYILEQIAEIIASRRPDAVIIAGDVYDKAVPSAEAVMLLDGFLNSLEEIGAPVFIISGNHDSAERLSFASSLLKKNRIYIASVYNGKVESVKLGKARIYLLPFIKPANVRAYSGDEAIESVGDAVKFALSSVKPDKSEINILAAHLFAAGAVKSDSEEITAGGIESVNPRLFDDFDYVALGHIHRAQSITRDGVRYCGSPLKYSFSEAGSPKYVTEAAVDKSGVAVNLIPLKPLRDMREIKGSYEHITYKKNYEGTNLNDYMHITLTDEDDVPDATEKLRSIYPNIMRLDYDNTRTRTAAEADFSIDFKPKSDCEIFAELYFGQNNRPMSKKQAEYFKKTALEAREDEQ